MLNPSKIWRGHIAYLSTSPVWCSHFTLGNAKKSFSTVLFIYFRVFTLPHINPLAYPTWKCHTLCFELQNFVNRLKANFWHSYLKNKMWTFFGGTCISPCCGRGLLLQTLKRRQCCWQPWTLRQWLTQSRCHLPQCSLAWPLVVMRPVARLPWPLVITGSG